MPLQGAQAAWLPAADQHASQSRHRSELHGHPIAPHLLRQAGQHVGVDALTHEGLPLLLDGSSLSRQLCRQHVALQLELPAQQTHITSTHSRRQPGP